MELRDPDSSTVLDGFVTDLLLVPRTPPPTTHRRPIAGRLDVATRGAARDDDRRRARSHVHGRDRDRRAHQPDRELAAGGLGDPGDARPEPRDRRGDRDGPLVEAAGRTSAGGGARPWASSRARTPRSTARPSWPAVSPTRSRPSSSTGATSSRVSSTPRSTTRSPRRSRSTRRGSPGSATRPAPPAWSSNRISWRARARRPVHAGAPVPARHERRGLRRAGGQRDHVLAPRARRIRRPARGAAGARGAHGHRAGTAEPGARRGDRHTHSSGTSARHACQRLVAGLRDSPLLRPTEVGEMFNIVASTDLERTAVRPAPWNRSRPPPPR